MHSCPRADGRGDLGSWEGGPSSGNLLPRGGPLPPRPLILAFVLVCIFVFTIESSLSLSHRPPVHDRPIARCCWRPSGCCWRLPCRPITQLLLAPAPGRAMPPSRAFGTRPSPAIRQLARLLVRRHSRRPVHLLARSPVLRLTCRPTRLASDLPLKHLRPPPAAAVRLPLRRFAPWQHIPLGRPPFPW